MGSYNFTASAEKNNDENRLVIYNPDGVPQSAKGFQQVCRAAQP